ncbi:MAG: EamA family transporter [Kiloniellaceae bacterium]
MAVDPGVLGLVLLAAILHATWNAMVKAGGDRLVMIALVIGASVPVSATAMFVLPMLAPAAMPFLFLSSVIHYAYFGVLIWSYRYGDLSQVYPIARGAAPALVAVGAWLIAGESLKGAETAGVAIVSAGIMSLAWHRRSTARQGETAAIALALLNALLIGLYLVVDGLGGRRAGDPFTYIVWLFALQPLPLLAFALWRRRGRIRAAFAPHLKAGVLGGAIAAISYGIAIWALSVAPMAHIVAVRETSVLFAAAIGTLLLKEPFGRRRIAASAVVAGGAVLLNLGG